jgi:hypothetical protein
MRPGREVVSLKASAGKDCFPLITLEQGRFLTEIRVGETPPTAGQPENGLCPELWVGHVHEDQAAAGFDQFVQVLQRRTDVAHSVKYVRPDDEVERLSREALLRARLLDVEYLVLNFGEVCELLGRRGEEPG